MSDATMPAGVRRLIDAHLDAVEDVLKATGASRERRRDVAGNVEAQFAEMLAARCPNGEPTVADARAVLATMDLPSAYAGDGTAPDPVRPVPSPEPAPARSRMSALAVVGLVFAALGTIGALLVVLLILLR